MLFDSQDHGLLQELVAHQKLLAGSRDVSVSVLDSHASKSSLLHLEGYKSCEIEADLGLLGWMDTWVGGSGKDVEALITDLVYHFCFKINYRKT